MIERFMLLDYFDKGGFVMWPLLFLSIMSVTFIGDRFWYYYWVARKNSRFLSEFIPYLKKKNQNAAILVCNNHNSPLSVILKAGLLKLSKGRVYTEKAMERAGIQQLSLLERGLGGLSSIGNISPLLGFLGTVLGMIKSFDVIAYQGLNNPSLVAIGIKEALITTATGLIIAIPSLAAYNYFTSVVNSFIRKIEEQSEDFLDLFFEEKE